MKRSRRHIRESAIVAACFAAIFVVAQIGYLLTGARKFGGPAKPKTLLEVLHDSPKLLAIGLLTFVVTWWFQAGKKETVHVICRNCRESFDEVNVPHGLCIRCNGPLEPLEGYYERHPELGANTLTLPDLETCVACGKASRDCRDFVCPDCRSTR